MKNKITFLSILLAAAFSGYSQIYVWTQKASFTPGNRAGAFAFSIGNRGYVGSGIFQSGTNIYPIADFWQYDPLTDTWKIGRAHV